MTIMKWGRKTVSGVRTRDDRLVTVEEEEMTIGIENTHEK